VRYGLDSFAIMNNIFKRLLLCALLAISFAAHADSSYEWRITAGGTVYADGNAACAAYGAAVPSQPQPFSLGPVIAPGDATAVYGCLTGLGDPFGSVRRDTNLDNSCPDPSFTFAGVCHPPCPSGQVHRPGSVDACTVPGRDGCDTGMHDDTTGGYRQCVADCKSGEEENATGQCIPKKLCAPYEALDANGFCRSNTSPTAPPKPPLNPPKDDGTCPSGSSNVGTDSTGTAICQSTGTPPTDTKTTHDPTQITTNPDGSTTTKDSSSTTNADGSKTTQSTTCTVDVFGTKSCQTTGSTGTKSDGTQGKSDGSGAGDKPSGLCDKNPELNFCKNSQVSGGCNAGVDTTSCTGDAIQCAILRQQKKEYCENIKPNPLTDLGTQLLAGNDPKQAQIDAAMKGDVVDLSNNKLDQSGFLGGGSCFANRTINSHVGAVAWDLGPTCDAIHPLRYVVLLCSLIVAYLVVSKSIIQG
jgi:hypothetical protein